MILEVAEIDIRKGQAREFETAMNEALGLLAQSNGFRDARLFRSHEVGDRYRLFVTWDRIEDHVIGWQNSEGFKRWRLLLLKHFASIPNVEHMKLVMERPGN
ncbi:antibiotic biosynthesis monooxygenase family protein [Oceanibacterium hippocampi]|uniref:Antibiotic biosynthesis monooxygenase n=1 Tax=Oceanibacterium hippocampi TaxID=745714 RepID=A0A1Y5U024_9PROT|nr:antibiotic biosynthesis monooxygenase family protein [Oceanibacterium hippocampi]SLN77808.1 Antibiotic biosynthesis monooxygenase [Oceanibacterium hippocampi]